MLPLGRLLALWLPGPSYLESYSLGQQDAEAGTQWRMLPAASETPDASGIGCLDSLLPKAPCTAVTWALGKKVLTCCQSSFLVCYG